jgi:uncharacterized protein YndB with AHSA1/START domain
MPPAEKLQFNLYIEAPVERVWDTMFGAESYKDWTSAFCEGSYFEGSWEEGARIRFLAPSGDGMFARIAANRRHEFLSIQHLGCIAGGVEDRDSEAAFASAPAFENYTFKAVGGTTELAVEQDASEEYEQYLRDAWPKALAKLKEMCERPGG